MAALSRTTLNGPTVLLTHTGTRSGERRSTPLAFFTDEDDVILIGSRGDTGSIRPGTSTSSRIRRWSCGRRAAGGRYRTREAEGAERERQWKLATSFYPGFASYQERAGDRRIPVVVCTPDK